jgi:hypothetical protein
MGHSEKSALKLGMSALPLGADIRGLLDAMVDPGTRLKDRMVKVQTTLVASPRNQRGISEAATRIWPIRSCPEAAPSGNSKTIKIDDGAGAGIAEGIEGAGEWAAIEPPVMLAIFEPERRGRLVDLLRDAKTPPRELTRGDAARRINIGSRARRSPSRRR